jgi:hypothetical protein
LLLLLLVAAWNARCTLTGMSIGEAWPSLPHEAWKDTQTTLHMWTQIVGKICLAQTPVLNHWWNVPLVLSARGLTTPPIPHGSRYFEIEFDFVAHELHVETADGERRSLALRPRTVADFHAELMATLAALGLPVSIWTTPVEVPDPVPFELDTVHASYDPEYAHRFWSVLLQVRRVMDDFRSRFVGKASPVHFFWGSFDLAHSRFSGRTAPAHASVPFTSDRIVREAYSHEVMSCGFWPGGYGVDACLYAYAYPEPNGFDRAIVRPRDALYSRDLREWLLPYEAARTSGAAADRILDLFESAYEAAADLGGWDRAGLEHHPPPIARSSRRAAPPRARP